MHVGIVVSNPVSCTGGRGIYFEPGQIIMWWIRMYLDIGNCVHQQWGRHGAGANGRDWHIWGCYRLLVVCFQYCVGVLCLALSEIGYGAWMGASLAAWWREAPQAELARHGMDLLHDLKPALLAVERYRDVARPLYDMIEVTCRTLVGPPPTATLSVCPRNNSYCNNWR